MARKGLKKQIDSKTMSRRGYAIRYLRKHKYNIEIRQRLIYLTGYEPTSLEHKWLDFLRDQGYCITKKCFEDC